MSYINIKFQTDQTGANSNVCTDTSHIFNFSLTDTYNVQQADIVVKKGSGTTESIVASIYNQANGGGSLVSSSTILAANVTQSYTTIVFPFTNTILSANTTYSLVISSSSSCTGSNPYSMKSGNFQVYNADTGGLLNTGYGISSSASSLVTITAAATRTPGQKIYLDSNKTPKFRIGSVIPNIYRGSTRIYYRP